MARTASGVYTRVSNTFSAPVSGTTISPTDAEAYHDDVETALNSYPAFTQTGTGAVARSGESKLKDIVSAKDFGVTGDGTTDDLAALILFRDAVIASSSKAMILPAGTYAISAKLELGYAGLKVVALGKVTFKHTGTGVAISFDAGAAPATTTIFDIEFGWGNDIYVTGNASTTDLVFVRSCHHCKIAANVRNGTTGLRVNFSVMSQFRIICSSNQAAFTTVPVNALLTDVRNAGETVTDCQFYVIAEGVSGMGVDLTSCVGCEFVGTSEANTGGGVRVRGTSIRNTFTGFDCEANGTNSQDWNIEGTTNTFINCIGVLTTSTLENIVSGSYNTFIGGRYDGMEVNSAAVSCTFTNVTLESATLDSTTSIFDGCTNVALTAVGDAWRTYTPVVTASAGTPTTVTATGRYKRVGKTITAEMDVTITAIGTASAALRVTLPVNSAAFRYAGSVFEHVTTGKSGAGFIDGPGGAITYLATRDAAAGSWWVNGYGLTVTITYEAA